MVIRCPKLRLQTICCFGGGASSSEMQLSPFSSRTVRSSTTLKFFRINVGFVSDSCRAVVIPITCSFFAIRFPTPQISSTGCRLSNFAVLRGFSADSASTP